jgi:shikimate 5-dehydrogenase
VIDNHPTGGWHRQGDHAMTQLTDTSTLALLACEEGFDPIEDRLRANIRGTIEAVFTEELNGFLGRLRYGRTAGAVKGYRHGNRDRQIIGTFGAETISVPRARIEDEAGKVSEWRSKALPRYQRLTRTAEALIASVYLAGTNTRRVKRALFALFKGAVSKDVVSRAWRKVKVDWDAWCARSLADEDIIRLILDGTVIKTRLDKKATNISVLAAIGAVNTVIFDPAGRRGHNTDYTGFKAAYAQVRGTRDPGVVLMIGTGGVGRAVAFGLADLGARALRLVDRDPVKAEALAGDLSRVFPDLTIELARDAEVAAREADGLVNCTPVGMVGYEGTPLAANAMEGASWAFDAVYTPRDTRFVADAAGAGLAILSGWELFFYQGVHAWQHFADRPLNEGKLRAELLMPEAVA